MAPASAPLSEKVGRASLVSPLSATLPVIGATSSLNTIGVLGITGGVVSPLPRTISAAAPPISASGKVQACVGSQVTCSPCSPASAV